MWPKSRSNKVVPISTSRTVRSVIKGETGDDRAIRKLSSRTPKRVKTPDPFSDEIDLSDVMSPSVADIVKVKDRKLEKLFAAEIDDDGRPIRGSSALSQTLSDESEEEGEKTSLGGAFASLTGTVSASAVPTGKPAPAPELAPKLTKLIDKLTSYKQRLEAVRATNAAQTATITKLKAEVSRLEDELELAQSHTDNSLIARLGLDKAKGGVREGAVGAGEAERRRREEAKKALFKGIDIIGEGEGEAMVDDADLPQYKRYMKYVQSLINRYLPLQNELKSVEACFGPTVLAYFAFSRWILLNFCFVGLVSVYFFLRHIELGDFSWSTAAEYYMPQVLLPSGYDDREAGTFSANILLVNVLFLFMGLRKWIQEDMRVKAKSAFEGQSGKFAQLAVSLWDHSMHTATDVEELQMANGQQFHVLLLEEETELLKAQRTTVERLKLMSRRVTGIIMSITLQALAGYAIVELTITSSVLQQNIRTGSVAFLSPIASSIVPAAVSIMNGIQPTLIAKIATFEGWDDSGSYIKWMVWRLFISKLLNVIIQVFTFALLSDPYLLQGKTYGFDKDFLAIVRRSATPIYQEQNFSCRADQTAASLVRLILTEFIIGKIITIAVPLVTKLVARIRKQPYKKIELDLPNKMAGLLYFVSLCLSALVWSPLSVFLIAPAMYLNFRYDKFILFQYLQKPLRTWSARDAGIFFVKFYLITQAISVAMAVVVMSNQTYPKNCSVMSTVIDDLYGGTDPYCTALASAQASVTATESATSRLTTLGGEAERWFRTECLSQCTTTTGSPGATQCGIMCTNAINVTLGCGVATPSFNGSVLIGANATRPCDLACGPFVDYQNGWAAANAALKSQSDLLYGIYSGLQLPAVLLAACICLLTFACMKWNSLSVVEELSYQRETALKASNEQMARKLRVQAKRLALLQGAAADE